jgi:hypothetical protein
MPGLSVISNAGDCSEAISLRGALEPLLVRLPPYGSRLLALSPRLYAVGERVLLRRIFGSCETVADGDYQLLIDCRGALTMTFGGGRE